MRVVSPPPAARGAPERDDPPLRHFPENEDSFHKGKTGMDRFFDYTLTVLMTLVALMELVQVVTRYVFKIPVMGLEELLVYPAIWLYFVGSANASREDTQIKANVLDVFLKTRRSSLIVRIVADVLSLVVALWLTWYAWIYFLYSLRIWKSSPTLYVPMFYAESFVFLGMAAMTAYGAVYLVKNVKSLRSVRGREGA